VENHFKDYLTPGVGTPDIVLHIDVRWLSRYKFLKRFRSFPSKIKFFLRKGEIRKQSLKMGSGYLIWHFSR
jgi:hypothetical protein